MIFFINSGEVKLFVKLALQIFLREHFIKQNIFKLVK